MNIKNILKNKEKGNKYLRYRFKVITDHINKSDEFLRENYF